MRLLLGVPSSSEDVDEIGSTTCRNACFVGVACFGLVGVDAFLVCFSGVTCSSSESLKRTVLAFSRGPLNGRFPSRLRLPLELTFTAGRDAGVALEGGLRAREGVTGALKTKSQSYAKGVNTLSLLPRFGVLISLALAVQDRQVHQRFAADEQALKAPQH